MSLTSWRLGALLAGAMCAAPLAAHAQSASAQSASAPSGTIYMGTYANKILVIDEATLTIRDSIQMSIGIPTDLTLSTSRAHFYVGNPRSDWVEIVDIASRKTTGKFTLNTPNTTVQIDGMNIDPKERFAILLVKSFTKLSDRYEISKPMLLRYDLAKRAVTDTIAWPNNEERDFAQILFSPSGDLMYFFTSDDVLVFDAATLKQVDKWDLSQSFYEEGMGRINAGFFQDLYDEPGFYTGLFRTSDPVNHRSLMGVARVDLVNRSVDFYTLGPSVGTSFRLTPDRKKAYGIHSEVGNYQFWTFDLENRRVVGKTEFQGRSRMGLTVSSNGAYLYVHVAGNTIDVYDAATFKKLRTASFDADMTQMVLIPTKAPDASR